MTPLPLTFGRAMKVWWSYMWRGMLLSVPLVALVQVPAMFLLVRRFRAEAQPGQPIDPRTAFAPGTFRFLLALWIVMAVAMLLVQTQRSAVGATCEVE